MIGERDKHMVATQRRLHNQHRDFSINKNMIEVAQKWNSLTTYQFHWSQESVVHLVLSDRTSRYMIHV